MLSLSCSHFSIKGPTFCATLCNNTDHYCYDSYCYSNASNRIRESPQFAQQDRHRHRSNGDIPMCSTQGIGDADAAGQTVAHSSNNNNSADKSSLVNPYQVLQVRRDANIDEIKQAYRKQALLCHPYRAAAAFVNSNQNTDRLFVIQQQKQQQKQNAYQFGILAACYETLTDIPARQRLDVLLHDYSVNSRWNNSNTNNSSPLKGEIKFGDGITKKDRQNRSSFGRRKKKKGAARLVGRLLSFDLLDSDSLMYNIPSLSPASSTSSSSSDDESSHHGSLSFRDHVATSNSNEKGCNGCNVPKPLLCGETTTTSMINNSTSSGNNTSGAGSINNKSTVWNPLDSKEQQQQHKNCSTKAKERHWTKNETNRLFGGPLQLLYRARRWKVFTDPYTIFLQVFGSDPWYKKPECTALADRACDNSTTAIDLNGILVSSNGYTASDCTVGSKHRVPPSSWTGHAKALPNGSVQYTTTRTIGNRQVVQTRVVRRNDTLASGISSPSSSKKGKGERSMKPHAASPGAVSIMTVTSQELYDDRGINDHTFNYKEHLSPKIESSSVFCADSDCFSLDWLHGGGGGGDNNSLATRGKMLRFDNHDGYTSWLCM